MLTRNLHHTSLLAAAAIAVSAIVSCGSSSPEEMLSVELSQDVVTLHEPVYVVITLKNSTAQRIEADFGIAKIGAFSFEIVPEDAGAVRKRSAPVGPTTFHAGGEVELEPGEQYTSRHLLNEWFAIDSPGTYQLAVRFTGTVTNQESEELPVVRHFSLPLTVLPSDQERLREQARRLLQIACSQNLGAAQEAAKELSNIRDVAVTGHLIDMLECSYLAQVEAVAGLARLGTSDAIEALIEAARRSDQEVAELARTSLRSHLLRGASQLDPDQRRRIEEVLQE